MTPAVTVVIPTRNRRQLLLRTLRTVLAQECVDVLVTVVDEASSDGTGDELVALGDDRVSVVRHDSPKGVAAARNAGVAQARGEWVAFLDDDDLWAPDKLRRQLEAMEADGEARWACVGCVVVDGDLSLLEAEEPPPERDIARPSLGYNMIPGGGSGVLASRALVEEAGGFDPALRNLADWDMWTRLAQRSPVASVARPLLAYLRHGASLSHSIAGTEEELDHVLAKHAARRRQLDVDENRAWWLSWIGEMHQRAGRRLPAAAVFLDAGRHGDRLAWRRAVEAAIWPGRMRWRDRRLAREMPPGWREEAEAWLEPLKGPTATTPATRVATTRVPASGSRS
jgi:GT2 family glycosyltransferase